MTNLRDIIEAARTPIPPIDAPTFPEVISAHREFDRIFRDPEHVALMEAVCEAEDSGTDEELTAAGAALQAFRKEHGYE